MSKKLSRIDNQTAEAVKQCIDERAIPKIAKLCRIVHDCEKDGCPFCFKDSRGFTFCVFMLNPEEWAKYIDFEKEEEV